MLTSITRKTTLTFAVLALAGCTTINIFNGDSATSTSSASSGGVNATSSVGGAQPTTGGWPAGVGGAQPGLELLSFGGSQGANEQGLSHTSLFAPAVALSRPRLLLH